MYNERRKMNSMELPEEMLTEILVKLPVTSSCVCKAWRDLIIGNSYFSEKHSKINKDIMVFSECWELGENEEAHEYRLITNNWPFSSRALEIPNILGYGTIAGSCNGIICLALLLRNVALYNPITREHTILPPSLLGSDDFYKTYGNEILSFGFDQSTDDYKVVRICFDDLLTTRYVEIYRLRMKCWRKVEFRNLPLLDHISFYHESPIGVFMNGTVHWEVDNPLLRIFTFDFEAEEFGEMESAQPGYDASRTCVALVDDSLALVVTKHGFKEVG